MSKRKYRCRICKDLATMTIVVKSLTSRRQLTERRCTACAHDVCVVGRANLEKLRIVT